MGKFYCTVEGKWCKLLRKNKCKVTGLELDDIDRCPRVKSIETVRFSDLLREVDFDNVYKRLVKWFPDQTDRLEQFRSVYEDLIERKPGIHHLDDFFIEVTEWKDGSCSTLDISGKKPNGKIRYGIEFYPWDDWVSMFITQDTLDKLSKEDIVAGCLYEMTYFGWTDEMVMERKRRMTMEFKEMKEEQKDK